MSLEARPYIGTWRLSGKKLVQHTPDAMVYLNGDTALPGCGKCNGKIDLQRFLTEVSVDAGVDPGSASASFSLSIPLHHSQSFARDAKFLLRPGLEVHIYMRGYFPVVGLYKTLAEGKVRNEITGSSQAPEFKAKSITGSDAKKPVKPNGKGYSQKDMEHRRKADSGKIVKRMQKLVAMLETVHQYLEQQGYKGVQIKTQDGYAFPSTATKASVHVDGSTHFKAKAVDIIAVYTSGDGTTVPIDRTEVWASIMKLRDSGHLPHSTGVGMYLKKDQDPTSTPVWSGNADSIKSGWGHIDFAGKRGWIWVGGKANKAKGKLKQRWLAALQSRIDELPDPDSTVGPWQQNRAGQYPGDKASEKIEGKNLDFLLTEASSANRDPSLLEEYGLQGMGIENTLAYPYYHVFHGVVTEVSHSYSGGVNTISINCSSMLHFWQYQNMSTNASLFGARPRNSKLKMSLVGHNFTGMHPYQILYTLHHDMVGAAGGVGWALSSKSNQKAVSEFGGESLFSLNIKYWERRFSGRTIRLRMHGATGELFSTMAAAWLGRTSSARIMAIVRERFNLEDLSGGTKQILNQSAMVGLTNAGKRQANAATEAKRQAIAATVLSINSRGGGKSNSTRFELNIVEMQAFVSNIGNWGQVNLFESSYESKLDIAQKIMGITGFEFYQDVDGDFVFKPPMWNLDTSGSRVYRIEDIDIINISFSEKEPQVTYMTCKGSQFKGLQGTGLENEWGVRGQFIDYRLVAQFGWRPGTYETAYFNDSKSMFFSAVNRMDVMNIGVNSASVTIPIRPEIRPGYPVYIPYLDCFYYCNSFAHSHAVGGQCTTSLQLVGKRAKFYAPGKRASRSTGHSRGSINDIRLGNTALPERPLRVLIDGEPRLAGFPNVVMALDPNKINPLFFVVGNDMVDLRDMRTIKSLLKLAVDESVLRFEYKLANGGIVYSMTSEYTKVVGKSTQGIEVLFYFQEDDFKVESAPKGAFDEASGVGETLLPGEEQLHFETFNISRLVIDYDRLIRASTKDRKRSEAALLDTQAELIDKQAEKRGLQVSLNSLSVEKRKKAKQRIKVLTVAILEGEATLDERASEINRARKAMESGWRDPSDGTHLGVAFLLEMLTRVGQKYRLSEDFQGRGDLSSTINLLDMLSDKKAIFSNGTQPGTYRYYSASHPDGAEQAPKIVSYEGGKGKTSVGDRAKLVNPPEILQFSQYGTAKPGQAQPDTSLVKGRPEFGIKVLDSSGVKYGVAYSTSDILELMFTVQPVTILKRVTSNNRTGNLGGLGKAGRAKLIASFTPNAIGNTPNPSDTINNYFKSQWNYMAGQIKGAVRAAVGTAQNAGKTISVSASILTPTFVQIYTASVGTNTPWNQLKYSKNSNGSVNLGVKGSAQPFTRVVARAGAGYGASLYRRFGSIRKRIQKAWIKAGGNLGSDLDIVLGEFNSVLASTLSVKIASSNRSKSTYTKKILRTTFSPVFPVSDARGYEVIGNYRYGREVSIDPDGVFDQLHKKDVFSLLDKTIVEQILQFFVQNKGRVKVPGYKTNTVAGVKKTGPVKDTDTLKGGAAARYLNDEVVLQLRAANLTDKQILDYGFLLKGDGDDGQLNFSLANIFADRKLDGVQKIPVINAAYSLADMNIQQDGHICDCKAAESDVHVAAFGQENFLSFSQEGIPHHEGIGADPADAGTRWVAQSVAQAAATWRIQQQALRGEVLDRSGSHVVKQVANLLGIDTPEQSNAFTDALGIQGLDPAVRTSVFEKTVDDADRNFNSEGGPLQQAIDEVTRHGGNLAKSSEDDQ